jgi:formate hydrogenlyase subunit 3/multisubunit Na+/H+ antiporter MnhD subunit
MGLSAYPMVLRRTQLARHAGRIYLAFTLVGELALFSAMVILFNSVGSLVFSDLARVPIPPMAIALLLFGFGIKVALPGLHPWLPMVYSTAPLISAAVLSGPMMKAGLLGWLRFIPVGQQGLQFWGDLLLVLGTLGIVLGVAVGLMQRCPRAVLGYSSIAKMGLISALLGHAIAVPEAAPLLVIAIVGFAMHHLLVKSSLFLALLEWQLGAQRWVLLAMLFLAISLVGLPLGGGAAAKVVLKGALGGDLAWLLGASAVGTLLLMARFLWLLPLLAAGRSMPRLAAWAWILLLPLAFWAPFLPATAVSFAGLEPLLISLPLIALGWWLGTRYPGLVLRILPGDIIHPLLRRLPRRASQRRARPKAIM